MVLPFVKACACGNDFLLIDGGGAAADLAGLTQRICDRHRGIGADGVEWLFPAHDADVQARLFNADGSEAEISGNGTRCVAAHLCSQQLQQQVRILTGAGVKTCVLTARSDNEYEFEIAIGKPLVAAELSLKLPSREVRGVPVSVGNPHFVVLLDRFPPDWQALGTQIGRHPTFEQGVNVEFVLIENKNNIYVRFFERGVGETQSSGTGSCAAAVACMAAKQAESPLRVHAPGGVQTVRWEQEVFLRGSARLTGRGEFFV